MKLVQEERHEHYRRIVFPSNTLPNITEILTNPLSQFKTIPIESLEIHLYSDGPVSSADEMAKHLGDTYSDDSLTIRTWDDHFDHTKARQVTRDDLDAYLTKTRLLKNRQSEFATWLNSGSARTFFTTVIKKLPIVTLHTLEPKSMRTWGMGEPRDLQGDYGYPSTSIAMLPFLERIAEAEIDICNLVWVVQSHRLPLDELENDFLAQEALLRIKSAHLLIDNEHVDIPEVGRLFMEFTKNLHSLTLEIGDGPFDSTRNVQILDALTEYIPRVQSLTFIRTAPTAIDLVEYLKYAGNTIQELHLIRVDELMAPYGGEHMPLETPNDVLEPDIYWSYFQTISRRVPDGRLTLTRCTVVLPDPDSGKCEIFMDLVAKAPDAQMPEDSAEPVDIMPWIRAERQRLGYSPP